MDPVDKSALNFSFVNVQIPKEPEEEEEEEQIPKEPEEEGKNQMMQWEPIKIRKPKRRYSASTIESAKMINSLDLQASQMALIFGI